MKIYRVENEYRKRKCAQRMSECFDFFRDELLIFRRCFRPELLQMHVDEKLRLSARGYSIFPLHTVSILYWKSFDLFTTSNSTV